MFLPSLKHSLWKIMSVSCFADSEGHRRGPFLSPSPPSLKYGSCGFRSPRRAAAPLRWLRPGPGPIVLPWNSCGANQLVPAPPRSSPDPTTGDSEQRKDRENIDETGEGCLTRSGGTGTRIILGRGSSHRTARSTPRGMHVKETRALSTAKSPQHSNEPSGLDQRTSAEPGPSPVERGSRSRHCLPCEDTART